jgi:protein transport protein SEC24
MALDCAKQQISVDIIAFPTQFMELPTLSQVSHVTSGNLVVMSTFHAHKDYARLAYECERLLTKPSGYCGILRVRVSNGSKVKEYHGHYLSQDSHDMDLAAIYSDSSYLVEFQHDGKLDGSAWFMQAALLYTTSCGHRRIRVHSMKMPIANTLVLLFKATDLEGVTAGYVHRAISGAVARGMSKTREMLVANLVELLVTYRKYCSQSQHSGQLILPENLKLLPLYIYAIMKSFVLRKGTDVRVDDRGLDVHNLLGLPAKFLLSYLYPRMYNLAAVAVHATIGSFQEGVGVVTMPQQEQLCAERVNSAGVYLMDDIQNAVSQLWIGEKVGPKTLQVLFGPKIESLDDLNDQILYAPDTNERIRNVVDQLRQWNNFTVPRFQIVREKRDAMETVFWQRMVEDKNCGENQSYIDFLCKLHSTIREKMNN